MSSTLPRAWQLVRLGDVLSQGPSNGRSVRTLDGGFPVLRLTSLGHGGRVNLAEAKGGAWTRDEAERFIVRDGDFLLSRGNGSLALVGVGGLVRAPQSEVAFPDTIIRVRPDEDVLLPEYLAAVWHSPVVRQQLEGSARTTAGIYKINQGHVRNVTFPLPPILEQRRVVAELDRRLSHVAAAEASLSTAARRLIAAQNAVLDGLTDGTLLAMDTSSWNKVSTSDIAEVRGGIQKQPRRKPVKNKYPFLRVANVGRGELDLGDVHQAELFEGELPRYRLQRGDLLVVEGNGSIGQIGRAAMWDGSIPGCVHQNHLIRVRPGPDVLPEFLAYVWNAPSTVRQLAAVASSTSGLHTLSTRKVKSVQLLVPSLDAQDALVAEAERRLSLLEAGSRSIALSGDRANRLRRSILISAFSGHLVPHDSDGAFANHVSERTRAAAASDPAIRRGRCKPETIKEAVK